MRTSCLRIGLLGLLLLGISLDGAVGQAKKENLEEKLQKAKDDFRLKANEIEVKLILALEQRIESARKSGDKKTLDLATAERDQFKADGTIPTIVEKAAQTFQRQSAAAKKKLELVYRSQIKEYVKRSDDIKAAELQAEADALFKDERVEKKPAELITNGSFEDKIDGMDDPKWVTLQGRWDRLSVPNDHVPAQSGTSYIFPVDSPVAELMQEISLSESGGQIDEGKLKFHFVGYVRGMQADGADSGRIVLELLDADKKKTLDSFDSGAVLSYLDWQKIEFSRIVKYKTRWIRVRLISKRSNGNENNSYYDGLSLRIISRTESGLGVAK